MNTINPPRVVGAPDPDASAETDPELAALLDFEPAPRKVNRPDGWTPERQRRFIELIAQTGSAQRAAAAMRKQLSGLEGVYRSEGAEGFRAAWDGVAELVRRREERRLAALGAEPVEEPPHRRIKMDPHRAGNGSWPDEPGFRHPLPGGEGAGWTADPGPSFELVETLHRKFVIKLRQERQARLAGRIAEADFYLRQISFFEVALELSTGSAIDALANLRRDGVSLFDIAETAATRLLDRTRRKAWIELELERRRLAPPASAGDGGTHASAWEGEGADDENPDDLDIFAPHLLSGHGNLRTEPLPAHGPFAHPAEGYDPDDWTRFDPAERRRAYDEQFARAAAEEQVKWEAEMLAIVRCVKETGNPWADD